MSGTHIVERRSAIAAPGRPGAITASGASSSARCAHS